MKCNQIIGVAKRSCHWVGVGLLPLALNGCAKHSIWWIFNPKGVGAHASFIYMMIDVAVMLAIVGVTA
ncbi:MAG: hypothetical protein M0003_12485, partial [Acidithiobacillus sp.]|nr:hypothetical protein [Acidithiobacillus sp.]